MLPIAATAALEVRLQNLGLYLFALWLYVWLVAVLSLSCTFVVRARIVQAIRSGGSVGQRGRVTRRGAMLANLLAAPAAAVGAACHPNPDRWAFAFLVWVVGLLSVCCAFILKAAIGEAA
ncbi:MAG: hypothetical protein ACOX1P_19545 [Thermoguttaceae bacterium]